MSSKASRPVLQELHSLDRSLSKFQDQLSNILYGEEYMRCLAKPQDNDLEWLVDYLDEALDGLPPSSPAFRKCLRELRGICGTAAILPTSYTLPSRLSVNSDPFASGGYGDVYHGTVDDSRVCVKRVRMYTKEDPKNATKTFCKEAVMWKRLKHPNIVPLLGVTLTPFQLISNWMPGGDLPEYIKKSPDADRLKLLSDVAEGLCYLHSCNVIHGDLKGANVLVDDSDHARIVDFGLAMITQNQDSMRSASSQHGHTPRWAAPELLKEGNYSKEADIFSFAMVMIEVFTGTIPFCDKNPAAAMYDIMNGTRPQRPTHPAFTAELWELMQSCWNQDPQKRPAVTHVLSVLCDADSPAWKRLVRDPLPKHERISLITMIFSDCNQVRMVMHLSRDDAQTFIDKIDEALDNLAPQIHRRCLRHLYKICGRQAMLPRSLEIPLCYDPTDDPVCHGEVADLWKGHYKGQRVAAQVLRLLQGGDTDRVRRRFCRVVVTWKALHHQNVLPLLGVTMTENRLVMVSEWMSNGSIMEFTRANVNVDRLGLLKDVTRGLIYMHDQKMVHGNLKGVNILIDDDGHARLTGFNQITIASESTMTSPTTTGGTIPWMSPELLYPENFGLKKSHLTKESDCYALGMVIYEVLTGKAPFSPRRDPEVVYMVLGGERPKRPEGDEGKLFTDGIWEVLQFCWKNQPSERPSAKAILWCLEGNPLLSRPPDGCVDTDTDDQSYDTGSGSGPSVAPGNGELAGPPPTDGTNVKRTGSRVLRGVRDKIGKFRR